MANEPDKLPIPSGIIKQERDILEPDRLVKPPQRLPRLSSIPADWEIFLLHLIYDQIPFKKNVTLPMIWESDPLVGQQERLTVASPRLLVEYPKDREFGFVCDAMPPMVALKFSRWLERQVFNSRIQRFYLEPRIVRHKPGMSYPTQCWVNILGVATNACTISPDPILTAPCTWAQFQAEPEVLSRARAVGVRPEKIITNLNAKDFVGSEQHQIADQISKGKIDPKRRAEDYRKK